MRAYLRRILRFGRFEAGLDVMDDDERVHKRKAVTLTLIISTHGTPTDSDRSSLRATERRLSES